MIQGAFVVGRHNGRRCAVERVFGVVGGGQVLLPIFARMGQGDGVILAVVLSESVEMAGEYKVIREQASVDGDILAEVEIVAVVRAALVRLREVLYPGLLAQVLACGIVLARSAFVVESAICHLVAAIAILSAGKGPLPGTTRLRKGVAVLVVHAVPFIEIVLLQPFV